MKSKKNTIVSIALAILLAPLPGFAQEWPKQKPVQLVIGFGPGASTDIIARLIQPKLSEALGQTVVVENRPGAGSNIASRQVKAAAPDGYTILGTSVAFAVNPSLYANAGYDAVKDFAPIILAASTPNIITVHPSVPANSLGELIALAKKEKLSYASSGIGTTTHLSMERLKVANKVEITHIPYQPAQAVGAVLAGHTQASSTSLPPAIPQVKAGKLRAIAVTSAQRSPALPDVPTVAELGYPGFDDLTWFAFFFPAGTPAPIVARMNAEINCALESPDVKEKLAQLGFDFRRNSADEAAAYVRAEVPKWAQAVKDSGAKAE